MTGFTTRRTRARTLAEKSQKNCIFTLVTLELNYSRARRNGIKDFFLDTSSENLIMNHADQNKIMLDALHSLSNEI